MDSCEYVDNGYPLLLTFPAVFRAVPPNEAKREECLIAQSLIAFAHRVIHRQLTGFVDNLQDPGTSYIFPPGPDQRDGTGRD